MQYSEAKRKFKKLDSLKRKEYLDKKMEAIILAKNPKEF